MRKPLDITGQRFGRLVAVERKPARSPNGKIRSYWKCLCDCGAETEVYVSSLRKGDTKSCGCFHKERAADVARKMGKICGPRYATDMSGNRIGSFVVVSRLPVASDKQGTMWLCLCDCGQEFEARGRLLRNGQISHCPACRKPKDRLSASEPLVGSQFHHLTILGVAGKDHRGRIMRCLCDCGKTTTVPVKYLRSGNTKSCGCRKARKWKTTHRIISENYRKAVEREAMAV